MAPSTDCGCRACFTLLCGRGLAWAKMPEWLPRFTIKEQASWTTVSPTSFAFLNQGTPACIEALMAHVRA
eukprot:CAMPEP_0183359756 /NCGR_PEP_ID=MMETSP0164_2-20130417/53173_1 /TAXON_ID=221442 /ORGANISM="Coccolithus pelagicus ssp braarudi, Strain PLY182g" /LENGTH=69 /DNA_ID=CAMNT_0025533943 /DNA_START=161 /DNA_END=370 /DNA_ORIENTATION=-